MKITSLGVSGCGKFRDPVRVTGFGAGLNVLAAPNETGKSTLFAALRTALLVQHSSGSKDIKKLSTWDAALPIDVGIDFEAAGASYRLRKTFLKRQRARLWANGSLLAENREADEAVFTLVGAKEKDNAALGLLWAEQGESFRPPDIRDSQHATLAEAIEEEVGTIVGGDAARALLERLAAELDEHYTGAWRSGSWRPRTGGPTDKALKEARRLEEELAETRAQLASQQSLLNELADARQRFVRISAPETLEDLQAAATGTRRALEAGQAAASVVDNARRDAELKSHEHNNLRGEIGRLRRLLDERLRCEETKVEKAADLTETRAGLKAAETAGAQIEQERKTLSGRKAEAARALDRLDRLERRSKERAHLQEAERVLSQLGAARREAENLGTERAAILLTEAKLDDLERRWRQLTEIEAKLAASSAVLTVEPLSAAETPILLNGDTVSAPIERAVTEPIELTIEGVGRVHLAPPAAAGGTAASLADRRRRFDDALAEAQVASLEEARRLNGRRRDLENRLTLAIDRAAFVAKLDADGATLDRIRAREDELADDLATRRKRLEESGPAAIDADMPDDPEAYRLERGRELAGIERQEATLDAKAATVAAERNAADRKLAALEAEMASLDRELARIAGELGEGDAEARIAALGGRLQEAQRALALAEERLSAAVAAAPDEDRLKGLELAEQRARQALTNNTAERQLLDKDIARMGGQIDASMKRGLGEAVEVLDGELALVQAELNRCNRRTAAVNLLHGELEAVLRSAREAYMQPLLNAMKPFLAQVIPGTQMAFDDGFALQGLLRDGQEEPFTSVSGGTREQLAVLTRLGFGALLAARGRPVPIVLDEPLAHSDAIRRQGMFNALQLAAEKTQVIVFGCDEEVYSALGGNRLRIEPAEAED